MNKPEGIKCFRDGGGSIVKRMEDAFFPNECVEGCWFSLDDLATRDAIIEAQGANIGRVAGLREAAAIVGRKRFAVDYGGEATEHIRLTILGRIDPADSVQFEDRIRFTIQDARNQALEEAARWRKWPEEKPEDGRKVLVRWVNELGNWRWTVAVWFGENQLENDWENCDEDTEYAPAGWYETPEEWDHARSLTAKNVTHWRPIVGPEDER